MRRREFVTLLGGALATWPAHAQQPNRTRRIGVLIPFSETDSETQALLGAFKQRLQELGWTEGSNVTFEHRYTDGNPERTRAAAKELADFSPNAILAYANPAVSALMPVTKTIPIVFTQASDPVGSGFVSNLAHPGGNITGFHSFEPAIASKWLETLKQVAPEVRRAAVVHHPNIAANTAFVRAAESASGGLIAYGIDGKELWRAAASYIDRILRGEKPGDLPVQLPTKYHLVINLKAAKALGLEIPDKLLALADEVIE